MSQLLDAVEKSNSPEAPSAPRPVTDPDPGYGQFDYAPMPVLAPISAILGVCSLIAFLGLFGILLAVVGIFVSLIATVKVLRSRGQLGGKWPALAGLTLCTVSAIGGTALLVYNYKHEVPEGFERVSFAREISEKAFIVEDGVQDVHPDVKKLADKPIFVKGFMYPTGQESGLTNFLLLKDSGQCCFGGQPALQDMIGVTMQEGLDVDYYQGRVSVAGTFKINPAYQGASSLEPLFLLEAEHFSKSKTAF